MKATRILGTLATFVVTFWALSAGGDARAARFSDVPDNAWYADAVRFVTENNLMDGTSDTAFSPDGSMTCVQLAEILYRMNGSTAVTESDVQTLSEIAEVPSETRYRDAAAWAASQGWLSGYLQSQFQTYDTLSRGYLFCLLHRTVGRPILNNPVKTPFSDELLAPAVFEMPIRWARESEIIPRISGNLVEAKLPATRAYVAAVLQKFLTAYPVESLKTQTQNTAYANIYRSFRLSEVRFPDVPAYPKDGYGANGEWWGAHRLASEVTTGMDAFFTDISKRCLSGDGVENKTCSPLNIYIALGMLADTASGNTRTQLLSLMGAKNIEEVRERVKAIWAADYHNDETNVCTLANSLWMNQTWLDEHGALKRSATDSLAENFYASSFSGPAGEEAYDKAFQAWMNEQTGGLLTELLDGQKISPDTVLALVSAINFHSEWTHEFSENLTKTGKFRAKSKNIACDFMHETGNVYYKGKKFAAVPKSLKNGGEMWFILPNKGVTPEKLLTEKELAEFMFNDPYEFYYESKASRLIVNESIPKFDISSTINLKDELTNLGVTDAFAPAVADFTPLWEPRTPQDLGLSLYVTEAEHDARVTIDEKGCSAAAVTIIQMGASGGMITTVEEIDFTLDRPFLFMITDANALPLFVGIVNNPVE